MKNTVKYIVIFTLVLIIGACNQDENDVVPSFLDGTELGAVLDVIVSSPVDLLETEFEDYVLDFEVTIIGEEKRPIQSIVVKRTFIDESGGDPITIEQDSIIEFPKSYSLSSANLIDGIPNLSISDLEIGDAFDIHFKINYVDGLVVDRFDSSMRTNFRVEIVKPEE